MSCSAICLDAPLAAADTRHPRFAASLSARVSLGALFLLLITLSAALAYSVASSGNPAVTSALNDFAWAAVVLTSFPRAMLIMAGTFGLWRAGLISSEYPLRPM
jgi:hypothetical protein